MLCVVKQHYPHSPFGRRVLSDRTSLVHIQIKGSGLTSVVTVCDTLMLYVLHPGLYAFLYNNFCYLRSLLPNLPF